MRSPVRPETRFAKNGDWNVAYQVFGGGNLNILVSTSWLSNVEVLWEDPLRAGFLERLATFGRVVCFDRRGSGVSDPVPLAALPTIEDWMDDARVVLDACGMERAAVIADGEGGPMAIMLAATHPERVSALILRNTFARIERDPTYRIGLPAAVLDRLVAAYAAAWGRGGIVDLTAPGMADDPPFRQRLARYERLAMPPRAAALQFAWVVRLDVRPALANVQAPTLVMQARAGRYHRPAYARYLAERIPGAALVITPGADTYPFWAGDIDPVLNEMHTFLTGVREVPWHERVLATVLFTDIVDSTRRASELGDARWLDLRERHHAILRAAIERNAGREIETAGDSFLATFDGPARAIRCAVEAAAEVREAGLEIRAGLHTGEIERRQGGIGGVAVHIAARVMALAGPGQVWVSSTVRELVVGSGIGFRPEGSHPLKGVPEERFLYSVNATPWPIWGSGAPATQGGA
jgi:class 3 adenylate cyclase